MKVRGKERVAFNFIDLAKSFFNNQETDFEEENEEIEKEVVEIRKHQNNDFIRKLEKATDYTESAKNTKKNTKIEIKATPRKEHDINSIDSIQSKEKERE